MTGFVLFVVCTSLVLAFILTPIMRGLRHFFTVDIKRPSTWVVLAILAIVILANYK